jgi:hypothetical protein
MVAAWEAHQGQDYIVVMKASEGTDNASIKISTGNHAEDIRLARRIANELNGVTAATVLIEAEKYIKDNRPAGIAVDMAIESRAVVITAHSQDGRRMAQAVALSELDVSPVAMKCAIDLVFHGIQKEA